MAKHSPETLSAHAYALAKAFGVLLVLDDTIKPSQAFAGSYLDSVYQQKVVGSRIVVGHPIVNERTYAIVLHEMGHHVDPMGQCAMSMIGTTKDPTHPRYKWRLYHLMIEEEEAAWNWAKYYALEWTPAMEEVRQWALESYRKVIP